MSVFGGTRLVLYTALCLRGVVALTERDGQVDPLLLRAQSTDVFQRQRQASTPSHLLTSSLLPIDRETEPRHCESHVHEISPYHDITKSIAMEELTAMAKIEREAFRQNLTMNKDDMEHFFRCWRHSLCHQCLGESECSWCPLVGRRRARSRDGGVTGAWLA